MALSAKQRLNVLWHALSSRAKKLADRDQLEPGTYRVAGAVNATVGRAVIADVFAGDLIVGDAQPTTSSSGPDYAHLCALLLSKLPPAKAQRLMDSLPRDFETHGTLPHVDPERVKEVEHLFSLLRSKRTVERRGNVVFRAEQPEPTAA